MTSILTTCIYTSPVGRLLLGSYAGQLCLCDWLHAPHREQVDRRIRQALQADFRPGSSAVLTETVRQLDAYFAGTLRTFSLPLCFTGTCINS